MSGERANPVILVGDAHTTIKYGFLYSYFKCTSFHICVLEIRVLTDASKVSVAVFGQKNKSFWAIVTFWARKLQVYKNDE